MDVDFDFLRYLDFSNLQVPGQDSEHASNWSSTLSSSDRSANASPRQPIELSDFAESLNGASPQSQLQDALSPPTLAGQQQSSVQLNDFLNGFNLDRWSANGVQHREHPVIENFFDTSLYHIPPVLQTHGGSAAATMPSYGGLQSEAMPAIQVCGELAHTQPNRADSVDGHLGVQLRSAAAESAIPTSPAAVAGSGSGSNFIKDLERTESPV